MKRRHQATLERICARPVNGSVRWADVEALLVELGAELSEREGSRVGVCLSGRFGSFIDRIPRLTLTRALSPASESGWKAME